MLEAEISAVVSSFCTSECVDGERHLALPSYIYVYFVLGSDIGVISAAAGKYGRG